MSVAVLARAGSVRSTAPAARITLLGTGGVAQAFAERHARLYGRVAGLPPIVAIANSRSVQTCADTPARIAIEALRASSFVRQSAGIAEARFAPGDIVVDATASDEVAACHAAWLACGAHVVTANKLGAGASLSRWQAIRQAALQAGVHYGDSATVGAGLPLLRSVRGLVEGGDAIHGIAGVLSGSLAWLFHHYDGMRPFSALLMRARDAGYTEPDPRQDLSGADVRRKLLILARSAGQPLEEEAVQVESLVPEALQGLQSDALETAWPLLDAPLRQRHSLAHRSGQVLRHIARLRDGRASVTLEALPREHVLAGGQGSDNRLAIWSERYPQQPLLIQGPGAGCPVTAAALIDDVLLAASKNASIGIGSPNA